MIEPRRSPECDRCQRFSGYCGPDFLVCAIHPSGPAQSPCLDFAEVAGQWEPLGGAYYNGELLRTPKQSLTTAQRWEILNTHPLFTGVCPKCGAAIVEVGSGSLQLPKLRLEGRQR
jgi:hypothetical protein